MMNTESSSNAVQSEGTFEVVNTVRSWPRASLADIRDDGGKTRQLCDGHVRGLAANIAALGLIHPLAVTADLCVLAGRHRLAALRFLEQTAPQSFAQHFPDGTIPIHVMKVASGDTDRERFAIELAENEKRRDYTPAEVRAWARRLQELGYETRVGRRRDGEAACHLTAALAVLLGKSERTVRRLLRPVAPAPSLAARRVLVKGRRAIRHCLDAMGAVSDGNPARTALEASLSRAEAALRDYLAATRSGAGGVQDVCGAP